MFTVSVNNILAPLQMSSSPLSGKWSDNGKEIDMLSETVIETAS